MRPRSRSWTYALPITCYKLVRPILAVPDVGNEMGIGVTEHSRIRPTLDRGMEARIDPSHEKCLWPGGRSRDRQLLTAA